MLPFPSLPLRSISHSFQAVCLLIDTGFSQEGGGVFSASPLFRECEKPKKGRR
ncbi:hypothetical protein HMPREF1986_02752 [Oribacterium sp. oral taxon 078 str. F0263]|nr:hypothetical protein HMPREF1986_02752 [Oribacterium sp. oral taxon 078 str. F0263]